MPVSNRDATLGDYVEFQVNGIWYYTTWTQIKALFDANSSSSYRQEFTTQRSSPTTGATVTVTDGSADIFLLITPSAGLSELTVKLPTSPTSARDKQEVRVFSTQAVTTLTVNGNGASDVLGEPASLSANGYFTLRYDAQNAIWYRVG